MRSCHRVIITTGDTNGIGWEVTAKALAAIGPVRNTQFIYWKSPHAKTPNPPRNFLHTKVSSLEEALVEPVRANTLIEISSPASPANWVEESAKACLKNRAQALVTGPLSKTGIRASGLRDIGHTEILARVGKTSPLFMGFIGSEFSVVLTTGHVPLAQVHSTLNRSLLTKALHEAQRLKTLLPARQRRLPLAVVGLNPHAGEHGLLGKEEKWIERVIQPFRALGPLVPDAAFLPEMQKKVSVYVCLYHDQGLIPFKMVHGHDSGVHLTLGLPFVRTSVDHGTAKDLYGRNRARFGSMRDAIETAIRLIKEKSR